MNSQRYLLKRKTSILFLKELYNSVYSRNLELYNKESRKELGRYQKIVLIVKNRVTKIIEFFQVF